MNTNDRQRFTTILRQMLGVYGRTVDTDTVAIWWSALEDVSMEQFSAAATTHIKTSRYPPTPADIRDHAGANYNGHVAPEEAWNRIPKSEYEGGWVTDEMMRALGACQDSIDRGDLIGARKAFLERYGLEISATREKPKWWLTKPVGLTWEQMEEFDQQMRLMAPAEMQNNLPQLEPMIGLQRIGNGLRKLDMPAGSTSQEKKTFGKLRSLREQSGI